MSQGNHDNLQENSVGLGQDDLRGEWVRQQTVILLRWLAIAGQSICIGVAVVVLGFDLPIWACILVIVIAAIYNLVLTVKSPVNKRVSAQGALTAHIFDLCQLLTLLYLTGGLSNPFALLLLGPVTISATTLRLRSTLLLEAIAVLGITILIYQHQPLKFADGDTLLVPDILIWGMWTALVIGFLFVGTYARRVAVEIQTMSEALAATQMALDREHKLTLLGGVVSAAAHEMGTPLATIKMVATELMDELSDQEELRKDATLIREQADRLSKILQEMGQSGKEDLHVKFAPLLAVANEAAEPHENRGKTLTYSLNGDPEMKDIKQAPEIARSAEVIHGLRNLVQNAVDFAGRNVWIDLSWTDQEIRIEISDDGPGFPYELIGRLGDPTVRYGRVAPEPSRPEYKGMGLGLFIAKTLLERTGAELSFKNKSAQDPDQASKNGAIVIVTWPVSRVTRMDDIDATNPAVSV